MLNNQETNFLDEKYQWIYSFSLTNENNKANKIKLRMFAVNLLIYFNKLNVHFYMQNHQWLNAYLLLFCHLIFALTQITVRYAKYLIAI